MKRKSPNVLYVGDTVDRKTASALLRLNGVNPASLWQDEAFRVLSVQPFRVVSA